MAAPSTTGLLALIVVLLPMASHGGDSGGGFLLSVAEPALRSSGERYNSLDCMAVLLEKLSPCAAYVEAGSQLAAPGRDCCIGLAAVADGAPQCLCALVCAADGEYGIRIDHSRASEIPGLCRVAMPPLESTCSAEGAPSPAPGASSLSVKCHKKCSGVDPGLGSPALPLLAGLAFAGAAVRLF